MKFIDSQSKSSNESRHFYLKGMFDAVNLPKSLVDMQRHFEKELEIYLISIKIQQTDDMIKLKLKQSY